MIDKVALLLIQDRKVLFARTLGKELFYTVGGKREPGESDVQALLREVKEETGMDIDPLTLSHLHTFVGPSHGHPDPIVKLTCFTCPTTQLPRAGNEVAELRLFSSIDGRQTTVTGQEVLRWLKNQGLIE